MKKNILFSTAVGTLLIANLAFADDATNPWLLRIRGIDVVPSASSSTITGLGGRVNQISSDIVPEFDISYFFNKNISSELILGTTKHDVKANNTTIGQVDLGSVRLLPPTLTVQYHFMPDAVFNPYVGVGINYTHFYDVNSGRTANAINYSDSFGPALQVGTDVNINKNWMFNIDIKKLIIQTNTSVDVGSSTYTTNVKINPMVYGVGIGYRFS